MLCFEIRLETTKFIKISSARRMIPKQKLGETGLEATRLGYGSMGLRGPNTWGVRVVDDEQSDSFLNLVLDSGINFIDTAPAYGVAEERIGRAISHRREEFYIATKCGCDYVQHEDCLELKFTMKPEVVKRDIETSLRRMKTDYIDLLQFHGGDAETLEREGLIDVVQNFKAQGLIRHIGISSKGKELGELLAMDVFEVFQVPYSCLAPQEESTMSVIADTGAGIIVRGGVAHGGPDAEIERPLLNQIWEESKLDELVPPENTKAQFILRHTLSNPHAGTIIVGTCNPDHMKENIAAVESGPLSESLTQEVNRRVKEFNSEKYG